MSFDKTGPIPCARDVSLADSCQTTPEVSGALFGMLGPLTVKLIVTQIKGGLDESTFREIQTSGNLQSFKMRELELLPEGQRAWKWRALYATRDLVLKESDKVEIRGKEYTVMSDGDWSDYGYFRYNLVEGYDAR